jgi:hypothetical protein
MAEHPDYVIWSIEHGAWWAPDAMGYVWTLKGAGRYTRAEAEQIVRSANIVSFNECMIPVTALEVAPELLDLLQRTVRYCPVEVQDLVYAAIAKAEGR